MRTFVIGLVVLFAVFTFVGALEQPTPAAAQTNVFQAATTLPVAQATPR